MLHLRFFGPVGVAGLAAWLLGGCASPATPRPPSLHLQEVASAPQAERVGDQVLLAWTTPGPTTDGGRPEPPLTAVLCREQVAPARTPCLPVLRLSATPGIAGHGEDTLPPALLAARSLIAYRIEVLNRRGRSAGLSEPAFAAAGPAPAPAGTLTVTGRAAGALITWSAAGSTGEMELTRTPAQPPAQPRSPVPSRSSNAPAFASDPTAPVVLRPASGAAPANGVIDRSVLQPRAEGTAFRYVAQRVETVTLAAHMLVLRGLPSPPAVFTYTHSFPPDAPTGLIAIPALNPPAIDLSWEAGFSPDLLGYNVYRRSAAEPDFRLLTPNPVPVPSYRDLAVHPGGAYLYRVTTADRHHNESAPSLEVKESVTP